MPRKSIKRSHPKYFNEKYILNSHTALLVLSFAYGINKYQDDNFDKEFMAMDVIKYLEKRGLYSEVANLTISTLPSLVKQGYVKRKKMDDFVQGNNTAYHITEKGIICYEKNVKLLTVNEDFMKIVDP